MIMKVEELIVMELQRNLTEENIISPEFLIFQFLSKVREETLYSGADVILPHF